MTEKTPVLFVGHGSPMNAVQDNRFTRALAEFGRSIAKPRAVLVVSAHWQTRGVQITSSENPEQIYDFGGFPEELYQVAYRPKGLPDCAHDIASALASLSPVLNDQRGIDHGAWAVVKHLFPDADIPLLQISLDLGLDTQGHYDAAKLLAPLREDGVLIVGSGNIVHNLYEMNYDQYAAPYAYASEFDELIKEDILNRRDDGIIHYLRYGSAAEKSVPTDEHFLPLLYAVSLRAPEDEAVFLYEGIEHGSVSMRCFSAG